MAYFIRHTNNPQADLERGYSFVGYQLFSDRETALETLAENTGEAFEENFDLESFIEDNAHRVAIDNVTGKWGARRSGLCAYVGFETEEEALETLIYGEYISAAGGDFAQYAVIFEGHYTSNQELDGQDEGCTFKPTRIVFESEI